MKLRINKKCEMIRWQNFIAKGSYSMGRRMRKSESVGEVEGLLNQALIILDASGLQLTAIHVDMAKNSLINELRKIDPPEMEFPANAPVSSNYT